MQSTLERRGKRGLSRAEREKMAGTTDRVVLVTEQPGLSAMPSCGLHARGALEARGLDVVYSDPGAVYAHSPVEVLEYLSAALGRQGAAASTRWRVPISRARCWPPKDVRAP